MSRDTAIASWSLWHKPLAADAPLAPTSADYSARLGRQARYTLTSNPVRGFYNPPFPVAINSTQFSIPVLVMPKDYPRQTVRIINNGTWVGGPGQYAAAIQAGFNSCPVPTGADILQFPAGDWNANQWWANGTDRAAVIICGQELWELFNVSADPSEASGYKFSYGAYIANKAAWSGVFRNQGMRAAGLAAASGSISLEDQAADTITHAIGAVIPVSGITDGKQFIPPATRWDGANGTAVASGYEAAAAADRLPLGARFRLPATFDTAAYAATRTELDDARRTTVEKIARAWRDYGLVLIDSGNNVALCAEDPRTCNTFANPLPAPTTSFSGVGWALPWESLQQLATLDVAGAQKLGRVGGQPRIIRYAG